jgi:hypothetical protein
VIKAKWIIGGLVAGLVALDYGPLVLSHSEQDRCSFGSVSNEEYRLLLSKASMGVWRPLVWNDDIASVQLSKKYRELLPSAATADAKVAAAHAVLRALGAELQRFDDFHNPNQDAKGRRTFAYRYLLDVNRLFYFAPIFRQMMITVIIDDPFQPTRNEPSGGDPPIVAHFPNASEGFYRFEQNLGDRECPPMPNN